MTRPTPRLFQITVRDAGGSDVPVIHRVRALLKQMLRSGLRLRAVRAIELDDEPGEPTAISARP